MTTDETIQAIEALPDGELRYIDRLSDTNGYDNGFTEMPSPRITTDNLIALAAELKLYREFVGAMGYVGAKGCSGVWDGDVFEFYHDGLLIATGTDPFDAWRNLRNQELSEVESGDA